jgi:hypothetical protein
MNTISINGMTIQGSGNVVISNGKIMVNGKDVTPDSKEINIVINGNVDELKVDACNKVSVTGSVKSIKTQSGDVDVTGDVDGSIQTMSGDVDCGTVGGSISTMSGDVKHRRS